MTPDTAILLCALGLALASAVVDVRQHRIPNRLTYPGILLGIALRATLLGWKGLASALGGCLLAGGIVLAFYLLRVMGAGDVKLLAAIGSLSGFEHSYTVLVATAISGGLLALAVAVVQRRMLNTLNNLASIIRFHACAGLKVHPELNLENPSSLRMPYGLAIASGTLYTVLATLRG